MKERIDNERKEIQISVDKVFPQIQTEPKLLHVDQAINYSTNSIKNYLNALLKGILLLIRYFALSILKDRENMTRRLAEEHDMRRLEQMEMQQRLDNNESAGKADITELYTKMKREQVWLWRFINTVLSSLLPATL